MVGRLASGIFFRLNGNGCCKGFGDRREWFGPDDSRGRGRFRSKPRSLVASLSCDRGRFGGASITVVELFESWADAGSALRVSRSAVLEFVWVAWVAPGLPWFCGLPHRGIRQTLSLGFGSPGQWPSIDIQSGSFAVVRGGAAPGPLSSLGRGQPRSASSTRRVLAHCLAKLSISTTPQAGSLRPLVGLRLELASRVVEPDRVLDVGANQEGLGFGGRVLLKLSEPCDPDRMCRVYVCRVKAVVPAAGTNSFLASSSDEASPTPKDVSSQRYDDVDHVGHLGNQELPPSLQIGDSDAASPNGQDGPAATPRPRSPGLQGRTEDDIAVRVQPSRHVDYLSHSWREEDVWESWKLIVSRRGDYNNAARLEIASWRVWMKFKNKLDTVSPKILNCTRLSESNSFGNKKPILKKRSIWEIMLGGSPSTSSLMKQHIHFNEQVSQCIVVEVKGGDDDDDEADMDGYQYDSNLDYGPIIMNRT
ncbi:hypothetical protein N658DRAFT_489434 [Parathielavia hyrcaniae]|uniref:Nitrogen regulatory protein areA GATA-like domain-containing protein n=1 Tax=Parathielavia hyrcaniae TaxID=113614 RepID=A0AAN6PX42_9PEZI|nr:hypothetical protein N658DRAFT_489434 [Parathielavia hyrcaniae]